MGALSNKTILFSGIFEGHERTELEAQAESAGAKLLSGVSKNLNYLVAGEKMGPSKREKAQELGVPIITLQNFFDMLGAKVAPVKASVSKASTSVSGLPAKVSAISDNYFSKIRGDQKPDKLLLQIKEFKWNDFDPTSHGYSLRNLLLLHEAKYGVTEVHRFVSEKIKKHLKLIHPYGHDGNLDYKDVSPDGRYLATADCAFDGRPPIQIWEIETGRIVNAFVVEDVGWEDTDKALQWSPDNNHIALSFHTNAVGVWNAFENKNKPIAYAYVTNGWDSAPDFKWFPDGKGIFIQCPYFDGFDIDSIPEDQQDGYMEDDNNGCRIQIEGKKGDVSKTAKVAKWAEKDAVSNNASVSAKKLGLKYKGSSPSSDESFLNNGNLVIVKNKTVDFYKEDGTRYGHFVFIDDLHGGSPDPNVDYSSDEVEPCFWVKPDGAKQKQWLFVSPAGAVIAHKDWDYSNEINWSLANRWSWPLEWASYVKAKSIKELFEENKKLLSAESRKYVESDLAAAKQAKSTTLSRTSYAFPTTKGKTFTDWAKFMANGLKRRLGTTFAIANLNDSPECCSVEIVKGIVSNDRARAAADTAFHYSKQCKGDRYKELIDIALKFLHEAYEGDVPLIYTALAMTCYTVSKRPKNNEAKSYQKQFEEYNAKAEECLKSEKYSDYKDSICWGLLEMYMMTDQEQMARSKVKEWLKANKMWDHSEYSTCRIVYDMVHYADSFGDFWNFFQWTCDAHLYIHFIRGWHQLMGTAIARFNGAMDHEAKIKKSFGSKRNSGVPEEWSEIFYEANSLMTHDPQAGPFILKYAELNRHSKLIEWLYNMASSHNEIALRTLKEHPFKLKGIFSEPYSNFNSEIYQLGAVFQLTGLCTGWQEEMSSFPKDTQCIFMLGQASEMKFQEATVQIEKAISLLPPPRGSEKYYTWEYVVRAACKSKAVNYQLMIDKCMEACISKRNTDYQISKLAEALVEMGDVKTAYEIWMVNKEEDRFIRSFAEVLALKGNYNAFFEIHTKYLDAKDNAEMIINWIAEKNYVGRIEDSW